MFILGLIALFAVIFTVFIGALQTLIVLVGIFAGRACIS
jgi:hypothetical protein